MSRHFERATVFVKWCVLKLLVKLYLVKSEYMIADIFTKAVDKDTFLRLRNDILNLGASDSLGATYSRLSRMVDSLKAGMSRLGPA